MKNKFKGQISQPSKEKLTYHERLVKNHAIDLRNNCIIQDLGNGYCRIIPIDKNKFVK